MLRVNLVTHFIEIDWSHLPRKCNMLRLSYGIQSNVIRPKIKDFELEAFLNPYLKMSHYMSKDKRAPGKSSISIITHKPCFNNL